jgi:hypothetical protein
MHAISRRRSHRNATLAAIAAAAVGAAVGFAEPAAAKPVAYSGTTSGGYEITFERSGAALKGMRTTIPTTCVPAGTTATPRAGDEIFEPPGRLALGREVRKTAVQEPVMYYNDVTKNYRVTARMRRNGTVTGRLHLNFSYQTVHYGYSLMLVGYVCQANATFKARPASGGGGLS